MIETTDIFVPDWPAPPGIKALCTTRRGGVSLGAFASLNLGAHVGDDPAAVAENRRRLGALLPREPRWLNQVHGCTVDVIDNDASAARPPADAQMTLLSKCPCAVLVADCLPLLFCDRAGTCVAATHAGWRGLAAGVIERTIECLPVASSNVMAWLGPAIGPNAFEVGRDVVEVFVEADPASRRAFQLIDGKEGKYLADIFALARQRLASAGVTQIFGGGECTVSASDRYFSHRRDGRSGRMAAIIWRE
jgi:YfiH family protein